MPAWVLAWAVVCLVSGAATARQRPTHAAELEVGKPQPDRTREYRIKAAFLYNFIRSTTWPADSFENARSPLVVVVLGKNPFGKHLEKALTDKKIGGRGIELRTAAAVPDALDAHVVFDGGASKAQRVELLRKARGRPLFLVGELPGFAAAGAHFNFFLAGSKVRFEINLDAVRESRLEISSQVLKLARIVRRKGAER